jgi:DNA-binding SARP family transcriptional activator
VIDRHERLAVLLEDAVAIAEESNEPALLAYLAAARRAVGEWAEANRPVTVDLLAGRLTLAGAPLRLTQGEFALVAALALNGRGIGREVLAEDLYPGVSPRRAMNALKVYVYRVRRRVGHSNVIRSGGGRYALGNSVDVELFRLESKVRRLRLDDDALSTDTRDGLDRLQRRLSDGRPQFMLDCEWFAETERRICELTRDVTLVLARDALRRGDPGRALALAGDLSHEDPLDEAAPEITIRACLSAGNHLAARCEYERYAGVLRRELRSTPSELLRKLLAEPWPHVATVQRAQRYVAGA